MIAYQPNGHQTAFGCYVSQEACEKDITAVLEKKNVLLSGCPHKRALRRGFTPAEITPSGVGQPLSFHLLHQFEVFAHERPNSFRTKTPFVLRDRLPPARSGEIGGRRSVCYLASRPRSACVSRLACFCQVDHGAARPKD